MAEERAGDVFVRLFNQIDDALRQLTELDRGSGFTQVVRSAKSRSATVRSYEDDLLEFAELRNAIVHDRDFPKVIADPRPEVIVRLEQIAAALITPARVNTFFKPVHLFTASDPLSAALTEMREHDFSQV